MRHIIPLLLIVLVFIFAGTGETNDVARIHVIANSDSDSDLEIKSKVAESLVGLLEKENFTEVGDIESGLRELLPEIEASANETLGSLGVPYRARAEVRMRYFDKRSLGNSSFPAGEYLSLIVTLGDGEGHNWWSVLFPEISTQASLSMGEAEGSGKNICIGGESIVKIRCLIFDVCKFILTKR